MSNYKTHTKFNLFLALPILAVSAYYLFHPSWKCLALFSATYFYSTLFMSPDMDLAHQIRLWSIRGILTSPFRLYSKIFSHRGLSHSIVFGTLTRLLFLAALVLLVLFLINQSIPNRDAFILMLRKHQAYFSYGFAGVFLADVSHLLLDL